MVKRFVSSLVWKVVAIQSCIFWQFVPHFSNIEAEGSFTKEQKMLNTLAVSVPPNSY